MLGPQAGRGAEGRTGDDERPGGGGAEGGTEEGGGRGAADDDTEERHFFRIGCYCVLFRATRWLEGFGRWCVGGE